MEFPVLETDRLLLTDFVIEDKESVYALFSDCLVVEYYDLSALTDIRQAEDLISLFKERFRENLGIRWAIRRKGDFSLVGSCGFNSWNTKMHSAVIGYDLHSSQWGKGYAFEASSAIISFALNGGLACGNLHRIQADTVPGNIKSEKLLIKLGFKEEGLRRGSGYWKGRYHDLKCFGLLKNEFKNSIKNSI